MRSLASVQPGGHCHANGGTHGYADRNAYRHADREARSDKGKVAANSHRGGMFNKVTGLAFGTVAALTAIAALAWWTFSPASEVATTQDVVKDACAKATGSGNFDIVQVVTGETTGQEKPDSVEWRLSVSGLDFHLSGQGSMGRGPLDTEMVYADGVGYARDVERPWYLDESVTPRIVAIFFDLRPTADGWSLCPELEGISKVGIETLQGVETTRYAISHKIDLLPEENEVYIATYTWDWWVDQTGLLVQMKASEIYPPADIAEGGRVYSVSRISGVGEPNTITAPVVSGQ